MRNFQTKKGKWRRALSSTPALVILAILIIFLGWTVTGIFGKMQSTAESRKLAEEKVQNLQKQKSELTSEINSLNTKEGVEANIREKFGLAKEGEGVIVIVNDKSASAAQAAPQQSGFWDFFTNWFK